MFFVSRAIRRRGIILVILFPCLDRIIQTKEVTLKGTITIGLEKREEKVSSENEVPSERKSPACISIEIFIAESITIQDSRG